MDSSPVRVTLADVARVSGVGLMTASRALRNAPGTSEKTALRVQMTAQTLGYRPDPLMSALSGYRTRSKQLPIQAALAYVTDYKDQVHATTLEIFRGYIAGAKRQAEKLGYRLEELSIQDLKSSQRVKNIILHRGIRGIMIAPAMSPLGHTSMNLSEISAVTLGLSIQRPKLHHASANFYRNSWETLHRLTGMGYKRIGFATDHGHSARNEHRWFAAFQAYAQTQGSRRVVFLPPYLPHQVKEETFYHWLDLHQPDVVVISRGYFVDLIKNSGRRVPQDIGVAWLSINVGVADISGIDEQSEAIGELAVDLLGRLIVRGLKGIPHTPEGMNVDGVWVPGTTLRRLQ